jgi:hypothetical protein
MQERELRSMIEAVRTGRLSRRHPCKPTKRGGGALQSRWDSDSRALRDWYREG